MDTMLMKMPVGFLTLTSVNQFSSLLEINRVRNELFHGVVKNEPDSGFTELQLPSASGPRVKLAEKVYAPVKEYPKVLLHIYSTYQCYNHTNNSIQVRMSYSRRLYTPLTEGTAF